MAGQLDTQDWKDFHRELQQKKALKRDFNSTLLLNWCKGNNVAIEAKTEYHYRLFRQGKAKVDVFPTSSKVRVLNPNNTGEYKKVDIISFLEKYFK